MSVRQRTHDLKHHYVCQRTKRNDNSAQSVVSKHLPEEIEINRNQIGGAAKVLGGKIREQLGKLVGNPAQQIKGVAAQLQGKLQNHIGDAQEAAKEIQKP